MTKIKLQHIMPFVFGIGSIVMLQCLFVWIGSSFEGTDDQSISAINELSPNYEPWIEIPSLFNGDGLETPLFVLQGIIGVMVGVFYYQRQKNKSVE